MKSPTPGLAVALVLTLAAVGGCSKPAAKAGERRAAPEAESPGRAGNAAATRELEEKAAGYEERFKTIQASDMTAEEKAQAAGELVDEQQRTIRDAEDGAATETASDPPQ